MLCGSGLRLSVLGRGVRWNFMGSGVVVWQVEFRLEFAVKGLGRRIYTLVCRVEGRVVHGLGCKV